jgi:bifunctional non-homologous end joining protein LigD
MARLGSYRAKRDFVETPEPPGPGDVPEATASATTGGEVLHFVVQEHHARRLHWDLRLERDGVLVSWALPRGVPDDPRRNHLAVHVEDHPLEYGQFEGEIPRGNYGAGQVSIWDRGTYETHKWRMDGPKAEVQVTLHGQRLEGRYVLFQTDERNWMIHRMDPPADGREPMPDRLDPMLARPAAGIPDPDHGWAYEFKWDGARAIVFNDRGAVRVVSRTQRTSPGDIRSCGASPGRWVRSGRCWTARSSRWLPTACPVSRSSSSASASRATLTCAAR